MSKTTEHVMPRAGLTTSRDRKAFGWAILLTSLHGGALAFQNLFPKWLFAAFEPGTGDVYDPDWQRVLLLMGAYLLFSIGIRMFFWHFAFRLFTKARDSVITRVRTRICVRVANQRGPTADGLDGANISALMFGEDISSISRWLQHLVTALPGGIVALAITYGTVFRWDWAVGLSLLLTTVFHVYIMFGAKAVARENSVELSLKEAVAVSRVEDLFRGIKTVQMHYAERRAVGPTRNCLLSLSIAGTARDVHSHLQHMRHECIGYTGFVLLSLVCTWRYSAGHIQLGVIAASLTSYAALAWPVQMLFYAVQFASAAKSARDKIASLLRKDEMQIFPVKSINGHGNKRRPGHFDIQLKDVRFGHVPAEPLVRRFNLRVPAGQRVAIVGKSGCGKTTLLRLLVRQYHPDAGRIEIGGIDLREYSHRELRKIFGVVPQQSYVFQDSFRENVRLWDKTVEDEDIWKACEIANLQEFVRNLRGGLDGVVGTGGGTLSGGESQRLSIARAVIRRPKIFVFDEAFSSIDRDTAAIINARLRADFPESTVIAVTHQIDRLSEFDRIVELTWPPFECGIGADRSSSPLA